MKNKYFIIIILIIISIIAFNSCSKKYKSVYESVFGDAPPYQDKLEKIIYSK